MSRYSAVPLPSGAPKASYPVIVSGVREWVCSAPMRDLVAAFGGEIPDGDLAALLAWLDDFSARHWDFRKRNGGVERDEVRAAAFPDESVELIWSAATALGLVEPGTIPNDRYDHLLVLGGLASSCLQRTAYAAHLVDNAAVAVTEVAALGSARRLRPAETARLDLPGCESEVDVMDLGVRTAFGFGDPDEHDASYVGWNGRGDAAVEPRQGAGSVRTYRSPRRPVVRVLAAPSSEPATRRANTVDTYPFWAGRARLTSRDRVLVLTSASYVPFQHCDAIRALTLVYGCGVDTIGVAPAQPSLGPERYLQEIRSAIRSMRALLGELGA